jgi:hypothetical protein
VADDADYLYLDWKTVCENGHVNYHRLTQIPPEHEQPYFGPCPLPVEGRIGGCGAKRHGECLGGAPTPCGWCGYPLFGRVDHADFCPTAHPEWLDILRPPGADPYRKLNTSQHVEIRKRYWQGASAPELAAEYGVSEGHIYRLWRQGRTGAA